MENWDSNNKKFLGYPVNLSYDYSNCMGSLQYNINNIGDPFSGSNYSFNTMEVERNVLSFFAPSPRKPR